MPDNLRAHLTRGAVGTFALKLGATGLALVTSVLLTRALGPSGYGAYAYGIAWLGVLSLPLGLGLDQLLVRQLAAWRTAEAWGLARGLLRRSIGLVLGVALGLLLAAGAAVWCSGVPGDARMREAVLVALLLLPVVGLLRICESALRGLQAIPRAYLAEMGVRPLLFCGLVALGFQLGWLDTPGRAVALNGAAAAVALVAGSFLLRKSRPDAMRAAAPEFRTRDWLRSAAPLWLVSLVVVINAQADLIMLGSLRGPDETGVYAVAARGAGLVGFILIAVNAVLGPTIAALHASGQTARLQQVLTRSARMVLLASAPLALGLALGGRWFLAIWGASFTAGATALALLCAGQVVNAAMGSVGLVLIMTGHDGEALAGLALGAAANIALNALLIPRYGIEGAAAATAASMAAWNLALAWRVRRRLGLDSTALGLPPL